MPRPTPLAVVAFLAFFVLFFTGLAPFVLEVPMAGMEGSWIDASVYASVHRFAYGTQFVFTNGPLFPLYHREYAGDASLYYVLARLVLVLFFAYGFARLTPSPEGKGWLSLLLAFVILWPGIVFLPNDTFMLVVPLLTALLVFADKARWPTLIVGVILSAAIGIAKISFIPFSLGAFLLIDIALVTRRKPPLTLLGYIVASWAAFVVSGQAWDQFGAFLVGAYDMTAGYSAALALDGPIYELAGWLLLTALILTALIVKRAGWLRILLVAGFSFVALKAGFVRHDTHSVAAWGCTLFLIVLLGLPGTLSNWRPRTMWIAYTVPLLALIGILGYGATIKSYREALLTKSITDLEFQTRHAIDFASNPDAWLAEQDRRADAANAAIRDAEPLPALAGPVDALSNIQANVLAAGLDYRPRPTIQENMTFSPALIARNRAFLDGPEAPQHLLFAPGATDTRHPASIEGSLWPLLVSHYAVDGEAGGQLILTRRAEPLAVLETPGEPVETGFGRDIALPAGAAPIFMRLDIRESLLGKLADQAFKPPLVRLVVTYAGGKSETYRLIPGMIGEGMLISPTVVSIADYMTLASGSNLSGLQRPMSVRVETGGAWAYEPAITARFVTLTIPPN